MDKKKSLLWQHLQKELTRNLVFLPRTCCECCHEKKEEKRSCVFQAMLIPLGIALALIRKLHRKWLLLKTRTVISARFLQQTRQVIYIPEQLCLMEYFMRVLVMWLKIQKEMSKQSSQDWLGRKPQTLTKLTTETSSSKTKELLHEVVQ